jgi:hypothetical protein
MENIVSKKTDETRRRWETAIKDKNFDCIRRLSVCETRPEHFDRALADGKVSTNVYLRRIHNHALGMEWLLKSVIPRLQWPKPVFKSKRAITAEEHAAIVLREQNAERRDFYELLWHTGAAQSDGACLLAEDINWEARTICFTRKKLESRGTNLKPTLLRFSLIRVLDAKSGRRCCEIERKNRQVAKAAGFNQVVPAGGSIRDITASVVP